MSGRARRAVLTTKSLRRRGRAHFLRDGRGHCAWLLSYSHQPLPLLPPLTALCPTPRHLPRLAHSRPPPRCARPHPRLPPKCSPDASAPTSLIPFPPSAHATTLPPLPSPSAGDTSQGDGGQRYQRLAPVWGGDLGRRRRCRGGGSGGWGGGGDGDGPVRDGFIVMAESRGCAGAAGAPIAAVAAVHATEWSATKGVDGCRAGGPRRTCSRAGGGRCGGRRGRHGWRYR